MSIITTARLMVNHKNAQIVAAEHAPPQLQQPVPSALLPRVPAESIALRGAAQCAFYSPLTPRQQAGNYSAHRPLKFRNSALLPNHLWRAEHGPFATLTQVVWLQFGPSVRLFRSRAIVEWAYLYWRQLTTCQAPRLTRLSSSLLSLSCLFNLNL